MGIIQKSIQGAIGSVGQAVAVSKAVNAVEKQALNEAMKLEGKGLEIEQKVAPAVEGLKQTTEQVKEAESKYQEASKEAEDAEFEEMSRELELEEKAKTGLTDEELKEYETGTLSHRTNRFLEKKVKAMQEMEYRRDIKEQVKKEFDTLKEHVDPMIKDYNKLASKTKGLVESKKTLTQREEEIEKGGKK